MARRVGMLSALALVMFGIIFFRLWYLQILSGEHYAQQAVANEVREIAIPAPRGEILARGGEPIVTDKVTSAVEVVPSKLPPVGPRRVALYRRLGALLRMRWQHVQQLVLAGREAVPYAPVTIETDADSGVLTVLGERQSEFPGVTQEPVAVREYPFGETAAQTLGYVGQINKEELTSRAFRGVHQGTVVGQGGLEYYYDNYLRGTPGVKRAQVNAEGEPQPTMLAETPPKAGYDLRLTLDLPLQLEGERALREGIERAQASGKPADAGAYVAIDPLSGEILAMGSYPSFNPEAFTHPLTISEYDQLTGAAANGAPRRLTNNATEGLYPTGSTFKPITAMAALEAGFLNPNEGIGPGSCLDLHGEQFCNAGHADFGAVGLVDALKVSSDTYFFTVGERANEHGTVIQRMANELGVGEETGIDLPGEIHGVLPDAQWRAQMNQLQIKCEHRHPSAGCGYVSEVKPWTVGEDMDLAVGQGSLQTSPLQMAVAYSTLVTAYLHDGNGWKVRPHLGMAIDESGGRLLQQLSYPPIRRVHLNPSYLDLVFEGIHKAASEAGGTSAEVWAGWDQEAHPVYGKTGTAEVYGKKEDSWYTCYIADPTRPLVIATAIEQGGFGAETAAPISRLIAAAWFHEPKRFVPGSSKTN
jgi:penicillin-binding protein 2